MPLKHNQIVKEQTAPKTKKVPMCRRQIDRGRIPGPIRHRTDLKARPLTIKRWLVFKTNRCRPSREPLRFGSCSRQQEREYNSRPEACQRSNRSFGNVFFFSEITCPLTAYGSCLRGSRSALKVIIQQAGCRSRRPRRKFHDC
jgi:hypothetical protein